MGLAAGSGEGPADQPKRGRTRELHSRDRTAAVSNSDKLMTAKTVPTPSITAGPPLSEEPGLGSLTLPGFLRDVTAMYGDREALVFHSADGVTRWTYDELWEQAEQVAAALRASGVGKD